MTGIYEFEGWAARIIRAYHEPPINAFRVLALGLDGSNAVAIKVEADGTVVTSGGGSSGGNVTANAGLGTFQVAGIVTANAGLGTWSVVGTVTSTIAAMPAITGIVTVNIASGNVQYTEGDIEASVTGTAIMFRDGDATNPILPVTLDYGLPVQPAGGTTWSTTLQSSPWDHVQGEAFDAFDEGFFILGVRNDTPSAMANDNGDFSAFSVDDKGRSLISGSPGMAPLVCTVSALPAITGTVTVGGQLSTEAIYATHVSTGINLTSTTVWTVALSTPSTHWRHFEFINTTDKNIQLSFDGGTTKHRTYPAAYAGSLDLKANDLHETGFIAIRNDGSAPTRGEVFVHATGT